VTVLVLLFLAGLWAAVLTPEILRKRADFRPSDSIGSFRRQLRVLQRATPAGRRDAMGSSYDGRVVPLRQPVAIQSSPLRISLATGRRMGPSAAQRRRRDILCALLASMGGSLLLGLVPGFGILLKFHLALDVLFVAYVVLLSQRHTLFAAKPAAPHARVATVRYLDAAAPRVPEPALLRRTGN
jgi:hypothetical protein